jgi:hypothetical protein
VVKEDNCCNIFLLFPEKEAKSVVMKTIFYPELGEADPGGLGACPQKTGDN